MFIDLLYFSSLDCLFIKFAIKKKWVTQPLLTFCSSSVSIRGHCLWEERLCLSFLLLFIYYYCFLLYNIVLVLPYFNMNLPRVYTRSQSWTAFPYHPSGSAQGTSPKHPVSCIKPRLVIHSLYDILHVSIPFCQIIPPSPSPTESKRLFYTSVSLLLSRIQGYRYHLSKFHIYALVYCIGVFLSGLLHSV